MKPFWPFLKIMMYTLHRMYQRLLHPTKLYPAAHTVPLVYLYVPVHFLPVIDIPSTSRLSTGWTLKRYCTFPTRTVHTHSSTKLPCIIATTSVLTIFSTKLSCTNHYLFSTYINFCVHFLPNPTYLTISTFSSMYICY